MFPLFSVHWLRVPPEKKVLKINPTLSERKKIDFVFHTHFFPFFSVENGERIINSVFSSAKHKKLLFQKIKT